MWNIGDKSLVSCARKNIIIVSNDRSIVSFGHFFLRILLCFVFLRWHFLSFCHCYCYAPASIGITGTDGTDVQIPKDKKSKKKACVLEIIHLVIKHHYYVTVL